VATVHIKYFAAARERAGVSDEALELAAGASVASLLSALVQRHPGLSALVPHLRVAVNQEFAAPADVVPDGAEVALIPPVAGGSGAFEIVDTPLELARVIEAGSQTGRAVW
jgi:molybdopterin converting factor subunit 1